MAKLTFPGVIDKTYAKYVSEMRLVLTRWAEHVRKSTGFKAEVAAQLAVLTANIGVSLAEAGTPGIPTGLGGVPNGTGIVVFYFAKGLNTTSFEYQVSTDDVTFGAWTALPTNRRITGIAAGAKYFKVRGVNQTSVVGAASTSSGSITVA